MNAVNRSTKTAQTPFATRYVNDDLAYRAASHNLVAVPGKRSVQFEVGVHTVSLKQAREIVDSGTYSLDATIEEAYEQAARHDLDYDQCRRFQPWGHPFPRSLDDSHWADDDELFAGHFAANHANMVLAEQGAPAHIEAHATQDGLCWSSHGNPVSIEQAEFFLNEHPHDGLGIVIDEISDRAYEVAARWDLDWDAYLQSCQEFSQMTAVVDPDVETLPIWNGVVVKPATAPKKARKASTITATYGTTEWADQHSDATKTGVNGYFDQLDRCKGGCKKRLMFKANRATGYCAKCDRRVAVAGDDPDCSARLAAKVDKLVKEDNLDRINLLAAALRISQSNLVLFVSSSWGVHSLHPEDFDRAKAGEIKLGAIRVVTAEVLRALVGEGIGEGIAEGIVAEAETFLSEAAAQAISA